MHDRTLLLIALGCSCVGLVTLLVCALFLEAPLFTGDYIATAQDGTHVRVRGDVVRASTINNRTRVVLQHPVEITLWVDDVVNLTKNGCVLASGKKTTYNDQSYLDVRSLRAC